MYNIYIYTHVCIYYLFISIHVSISHHQQHTCDIHAKHQTSRHVLGEVATVFDVLGLLPVTQRLLQRLDDEAGCVGFHVYLADKNRWNWLWKMDALWFSVVPLSLVFSSGWWYTYPSEKYEFVNWDDDIPNRWKHISAMFQSPPTSHHLMNNES